MGKSNGPSGQTLDAWHLEQLQAFAKLRPDLESAATAFENLLRSIAEVTAPTAEVSVRVKSLVSVSGKILRGDNPNMYPKPLDAVLGLTDLIGGRIVTYTQADHARICQAIEALAEEYRDNLGAGAGLEIDHANSVDKTADLDDDRFGYTARHYIVRLHGSRLREIDIEPASRIGRKIEIQVQTALSHVWSVVTHDRTYKTKVRVPPEFNRRLYAAKALLDVAEAEIEQVVAELDRYGPRAAARHLESNQRELERAKLAFDTILDHETLASEPKEPGQPDALDEPRRARAALAAAESDWKQVENRLEPMLHRDRSVRVLYAQAKRNQGHPNAARALLEDALREDPTDSAAAIAQAEIEIMEPDAGTAHFAKAVKALDPAFLAYPDEPAVLSTYCIARLLRDGDAARLTTTHGAVREAFAECKRRFKLGADVPECLTQWAWLALFAGELDEAIEACCVAANLHPDRIWTRREQHIVRLLRKYVKQDPSESRVVELRVGLECLDRLFELLQAERDPDARRINGAVSDDRRKMLEARFTARPIVIVAGACDGRYDAAVTRAWPPIQFALEAMPITVVCGGTNAGISGYAGGLATAAGSSPRVVGYRPPTAAVRQAGDVPDTRYEDHEIVTSQEPGSPVYSPLGPIQTWLDFIDAGVDPRDVRIIGVNGGPLAGLEYRLGLTMGATVGVFADSGRAVADLLEDSNWNTHPRLARLFDDEMTVRFFVSPTLGRTPIKPAPDDEFFEALGATLHEAYRQTQLAKPEIVHASSLPWDRGLDQAYRRSSIAQARSMATILATQGFTFAPDTDPRQAIDLSKPEFAKYLDAIAPLEHARWNAERLAHGWSFAHLRSLKRRTSPYLVPFENLPVEIQRYDRAPFSELAIHLNALTQRTGQAWKIVRIDETETP